MPEAEQVTEAANDASTQAVVEGSPPPTTPEVPQDPLAGVKIPSAGELAARAARFKKKSDALFQDRQRFEQERKQWESQHQEASRKQSEEIASLRKQIEEGGRGNPLVKMKPGEATETLKEWMAAGTPEAQIKELQRQLAAQNEAHEKRWSEHTEASKKREEEETRAREAAQQGQRETGIRQFARWVTSEDRIQTYKYLNAEYTQDQIYQQALHLDAVGRRDQKQWTHREVVDYLEKCAQATYKSREDRAMTVFGSPKPAPASAEPVATPKASLPATGNGGVVRQKKQLSRDEEEARDVADIRRAMAADKIANSKKR
jgi:hypothetical protein